MNKKELFHTMLNDFFIIYTGTMFATIVVCMIFNPDVVIRPYYLWQIVLFSLAADSANIVFYSKNELSKKQMLIRNILHTFIIEALLLFAGFKIGMYSGIAGGALFALIILVVDSFVRLMSYLSDLHIADEINKKLRQRHNDL